MAAKGEEPIGSMGNDLALAVMSDSAPPLFSYFKQLFAQVTNPPIDPIRESVVMSIRTGVGSESNLLSEGPDHAHQLTIPHPILRNGELEALRGVDSSVFRSHTVPITWRVDEGPEGMERAVQRIAEQSAEAIAYGANVLILSDRGLGPDRAAIPSLLAVAAVHHHLVREGTRLQAGLVLESGEPREVHHFATLIGYGASAVNPYVMLESLQDIAAPGELEPAERNVVKAIGKGLLKTLSKMGISTIQSYNGAQIFEAVGLAADVIDRHFTGTASRIGGVGLDVLARETLDRHLPRLSRVRRAAAGRRRLRLAPPRGAPPVEPGRDRQAPARGPQRRARDLRRVGGGDERRVGGAGRRCAVCSTSSSARTAASRSTRSSRRARSCAASPPARCRSARSRARRTRRSPSP